MSNSFDVNKVLVIDDDEVARNLIANHVAKTGVGVIDQCERGDEAWAAVQRHAYEFIVLDWKLPGVSGLALFNRIRALPAYRTTPILVVSGFVEKSDFRLLQEFPCTGLMEKPFTKVLFQNKFEDLLREQTWYAQNAALIDTLVDAAGKDAKKAEAIIKQVLKQAPNPIPLALIAARRMIKAKMLKSAEGILRGVLKVDEGCLLAMNELGKVLHYQGQHKEALGVLRGASKLSAQNLSRLCLMGEVELNLRDPENARAYFEKALEIDADSVTARAGVVVAGNMREALAAPDPTQVTASFASILNTMGIALVRNGQYARGVEQYRSALAFLHSETDASRVAFNLGLGFLRWGKPNEALPWFRKSESLAPRGGSGKSAAYVNKLLEKGGVAHEEMDSLTEEPVFGKVAGDVKPTVTSIDNNVIPFPKKQPADATAEIPTAATGTEDIIGEAPGGRSSAVQPKDKETGPLETVTLDGFEDDAPADAVINV